MNQLEGLQIEPRRQVADLDRGLHLDDFGFVDRLLREGWGCGRGDGGCRFSFGGNLLLGGNGNRRWGNVCGFCWGCFSLGGNFFRGGGFHRAWFFYGGGFPVGFGRLFGGRGGHAGRGRGLQVLAAERAA